MTFSSMDYFVMLARERSFTKAAQQLHITQQSLSAHIAALEQELGCKLLVRHVPLELTYAGKVFLTYALSFQQNLNAMRQEFCDITSNQKGTLRIGIAFTRGRTIMPDLIAAFQREYPNIAIELVEDTNEALHKNLLNGETDLAIANFPDSLQGVELKEFYHEEIVLLLSTQLLQRLYGDQADQVAEIVSTGDLTSLQNCPFVMGDSADIAPYIGLSAIHRANFRPIIRVKSDNMETLMTLSLRGVGACFCPENLARAVLTPAQLDQLRLIRLGDSAKYPIRFGYLKQPYQWNIISEFIRIALNQTFPA